MEQETIYVDIYKGPATSLLPQTALRRRFGVCRVDAGILFDDSRSHTLVWRSASCVLALKIAEAILRISIALWAQTEPLSFSKVTFDALAVVVLAAIKLRIGMLG